MHGVASACSCSNLEANSLSLIGSASISILSLSLTLSVLPKWTLTSPRHCGFTALNHRGRKYLKHVYWLTQLNPVLNAYLEKCMFSKKQQRSCSIKVAYQKGRERTDFSDDHAQHSCRRDISLNLLSTQRCSQMIMSHIQIEVSLKKFVCMLS